MSLTPRSAVTIQTECRRVVAEPLRSLGPARQFASKADAVRELWEVSLDDELQAASLHLAPALGASECEPRAADQSLTLDVPYGPIAARWQARDEAGALSGPDELPVGRLELALAPASRPERLDLVPLDRVAVPGKGPLVGSGRESLPDARNPWPAPRGLVEWLERVAADCDYSAWGQRGLELIEAWDSVTEPWSAVGQETLAQLSVHADSVETVVAQSGERVSTSDLRRAGHALRRRIDVWHRVAAVESRARDELVSHQRHLEFLASAVPLEKALAGRLGPEAWHGALALDLLRSLELDIEPALPPVLAGTGETMVTTRSLLADLEQYELTCERAQRHRLAATVVALKQSKQPDLAELGEQLDTHYRGTNFRVVVSEALLNRLAAQPAPLRGWINDIVAGVPTAGRNTTWTRIQFDMLPNDRQPEMTLEANGQVMAATRSGRGPGRVYNDSHARFIARQRLLLDPHGLRTLPVEAVAQSEAHLRGIESDFDGIPLLGGVVRRVIRGMYLDRRGQARRETERKIVSEVQRQLSGQADERVKRVNQLLDERVWVALRRLKLDDSPLSMQTSDDRLTLRARLASDDQLAANTPRPRAPADSLASAQLHESAVNNVIAQLDLEGATLTLAELRHRVQNRFNLPENDDFDSMPDNVTVRFDPSEAARVDFHDGRIRLTIKMAEIRRSPDRWRNLTLTVNYRPVEDDPRGGLVRDGVVQLAGERLNPRAQLGLRGIFSKVFSKGRTINLVPAQLADNPQFAGLGVTQFLATDGWLAVAVGPRGQNANLAQVAR